MAEPLQKENLENLPITYDGRGLMKYHPFYHPNHRKSFTLTDYEYMCKYYESDGLELISFALGRTPGTILNQIHNIKKEGKYEYYKNLNKYWL